MFGWLVDLLVRSSVVGTGCACCEGKKEQLKKMQCAVLNGQIEDDVTEGPLCTCQRVEGAENRDKDCEELKTSYRYRI